MNATSFGVGGIAVICVGIVAVFVMVELRPDTIDLPPQQHDSSRPPSPLLPWSPVMLAHNVPDFVYTPGQAHAEMQLHRECSPDLCGRKRAAIAVLIECGHMVPDSSR